MVTTNMNYITVCLDSTGDRTVDAGHLSSVVQVIDATRKVVPGRADDSVKRRPRMCFFLA